MNGNYENGKRLAFIIGIYAVVKAVFNGIIGDFSLVDGAVSIVIFGMLFSGLKYFNYIVAALLLVVVGKNFGNNISNIASNWVYLIEGAIDIAAAVVLFVNNDIKQFFSSDKPND